MVTATQRYQRAYRKQRSARETPAQRAARLAYQAAYRATHYPTTPEERADYRTYHRERMRRLREERKP